MLYRNTSCSPSNLPSLDPNKPELWIEYLTIPGWLVRDQTIPHTAKFLYALIDILDGPNGCYASNKILGKALGMSEQHISNNIRILLNLGLVESNNMNNHLRTLYSTPPSKQSIRDAYNKCYKRPITNVISHIILNSNNKSNNKLLLKRDFKKSQKSKIIKIPKTKVDLLSLWNEIDITPNHRTGTKIHKNVVRYTNQLLTGKFGRHNKISQDFLTINHLSTTYHHNTFTVDHLKKGIKNMALIYQEGMAPKDKTWLKGVSLDKLIYNAHSHKSQLLKYLKYDVQPIGDEIDHVNKKANSAWIKQIKPLINEEKLSPAARVALHKNLIKLDHYYDWMWSYPLKKYKHLKQRLSNEHVFFDWYERWISKRKKITAYSIGPDSKDFKFFLDWLSNECLGSSESLDDNDYEKRYWEVPYVSESN